ncbi:C-type lectin 37Da [Stomoxys calcitrans]|uniref:C-type lectin domain-containing protein n=1 Tax=Stomoxys calcitrans TaxID=35570 RepID=A0A1I8PUP6_STOCA|nr:C-type lectin 37Da [Stomoxys calcitrans]
MTIIWNIFVFFGLAAICNAIDLANEATEVLGNKEYYFGVTTEVSWFRALETCAAKGMLLDSIESETEYQNLKTFLFFNDDLRNQQFWFSGSNLANENKYMWFTTATNIKLTNWASNRGNGRCIHTNQNFLLMTADCTDEKYFICSRSTLPKCGVNGGCIRTSKPYVKYT